MIIGKVLSYRLLRKSGDISSSMGRRQSVNGRNGQSCRFSVHEKVKIWKSNSGKNVPQCFVTSVQTPLKS